jgi:CHAT domain-containing protein
LLVSMPMPRSSDSSPTPEELRQTLLSLRPRSAQARFFAKHPELRNTETIAWLCERSRDEAKVDTAKALHLAVLALTLATKVRDRSAKARSFRAMGNALYVSGRNDKAITYHEKARRIFALIGDRNELARTLSASIQPLILTGQYDRALANAKQAQRIFTVLKDDWRLARLDLNTGNIYHRQDRFAEALKRYRRAHRYFYLDAEKDPEAMGVALHNIAMCLVSLNDFHGALATHQEARAFAEQHGMRVLVVQSDYNIAALHYLRGEHSRAIGMLLETLEACKATNDRYHLALCRLDISEIYLQLNLAGPAEEMAREASADFHKLGMVYETGKSLVNLALAMARQNRPTPALAMMTKARGQFVREKNIAWPFLTDFYQAVILTGQHRYREALARCLAANKFFRWAGIPDKLVFTYLLLARLQLTTGKITRAAESCSRALVVLDKVEIPILKCQTEQLMGRIYMVAGQDLDAYASYQKARRMFEAMRSDLRGEELKISFVEDKAEIYEGLVKLCLESKSGLRDYEEALRYVEQSKSRSLQDLMSVSDDGDLPIHDSEANRAEKNLRAEINWYSRRLAEEQLRSSGRMTRPLRTLQSAIYRCEKQLLRLGREMPSTDRTPARLFSSETVALEGIRASLPAESTLLEYFQVQDQLLVAVITREILNIVPVSKVATLAPVAEHLEFQLAKFRLGNEYLSAFAGSLLEATQLHLKTLYDALITPIRAHLRGKNLIIVPHGLLHRLPFQALFDGQEYLIDQFTLSYAPSATIHALCAKRPVNSKGPALVMGIWDAAAPSIRDEAVEIAKVIPQCELLLGRDATAAALQTTGSLCRFIHIATHGYYRQDSPTFSGIRLGDSILSLYDLYRLRLPAELIVLSGCATGVSTVAGGDELLGLVRGLIYAGARCTLLSLWDVNDRSTLEFMTFFYGRLQSGANKAEALQRAVQNVRLKHPHPYYWAPFNLIGNTN